MNKDKLYELSNRLIKRAKRSPVNGFDKRLLYNLVDQTKNTIVIGPRRIGKTTLLEEILRKYTEKYNSPVTKIISDNKEMTNFSIGDGKSISIKGNISIINESKKILYLKLDSLEFSSMKTEELKELQFLIRNCVLDDEIDFLLLDEIQTLPNWTTLIKDIKDMETKPIRIIGTGSNSNELMKGIEHGTGRYEVMFFGVLTLMEFKKLNNIENLSNDDYKRYIEFKHFPNYDESTYRNEVSSSIIEKAFGSTEKNKTNIFKVLKWVNQNPGSEIKTSVVGSSLEISRQYIDEYLSILQEGQIIFKLPNMLSKSIKRKVYSLIPGSFTLFDGISLDELSQETLGEHFENFVFIQLLSLTNTISERMSWGYIRSKETSGVSEIDFVKGQVGFEVKHTLHNSHTKHISFAIENGLKTLYFVYKNGQLKNNYQIEGLNIKYLKWDDFADQKKLKELKNDLNIF